MLYSFSNPPRIFICQIYREHEVELRLYLFHLSSLNPFCSSFLRNASPKSSEPFYTWNIIDEPLAHKIHYCFPPWSPLKVYSCHVLLYLDSFNHIAGPVRQSTSSSLTTFIYAVRSSAASQALLCHKWRTVIPLWSSKQDFRITPMAKINCFSLERKSRYSTCHCHTQPIYSRPSARSNIWLSSVPPP